MIKKIILPLLILIFSSCNDSNEKIDCAAVLCVAGYNTVSIVFLNETSGENLLDNGTIDASTIEIVDEQNKEVTFTLEEIPGTGMFLNVPVSTENYGQKSFSINFLGGSPFTMSFTTAFDKGGECCGPYTDVDAFEATTYSYEYSEYGQLPLQVSIFID